MQNVKEIYFCGLYFLYFCFAGNYSWIELCNRHQSTEIDAGRALGHGGERVGGVTEETFRSVAVRDRNPILRKDVNKLRLRKMNAHVWKYVHNVCIPRRTGNPGVRLKLHP